VLCNTCWFETNSTVTAFKAIRKKLGNKNPKVVLLALSVRGVGQWMQIMARWVSQLTAVLVTARRHVCEERGLQGPQSGWQQGIHGRDGHSGARKTSTHMKRPRNSPLLSLVRLVPCVRRGRMWLRKPQSSSKRGPTALRASRTRCQVSRPHTRC